MGLYDQMVSMDIDSHEAMMENIGGPDRFSVQDGAEDVPIFILRHPMSPHFCSPLLKRHFIRDATSMENKIVGVVPAIPEGGQGYRPTVFDAMAEHAVEDGSWYQLPDSLKELIKGSLGYDAFVLDMSPHRALLQAMQQAQNAGNGAMLQQLQGNFDQVVLKEPVKLWTMSRTVYNQIMRKITEYSRDNGGQAVDPTNPAAAKVLYVSKIKGTNGRYQYSVRWWWKPTFRLPEALFEGAGGSVQTVEKYVAEFLKQAAQWPDSRVREVLGQAGVGPQYLTAAPQANMIQATPVVQALPAQQVTAPQVQQWAPPEASKVSAPVVPAMTTVQQPPAASAGMTSSAADLPCFGKTPNLADPKCQQCSKNSECLQAVITNQQKIQGMATAPAVPVPPQAAAPAEPAAPATPEVTSDVKAPATPEVTSDVEAKVQAALAAAMTAVDENNNA